MSKLGWLWQAGKDKGIAGLAGVGVLGATAPDDAEAGVITRAGKRLIEAWHGSPHKFDKFDISKIGTGEGAQAYGHGLYFADEKAVADDYRKRLGAFAEDWPDYTFDGDRYEWGEPEYEALAAMTSDAGYGAVEGLLKENPQHLLNKGQNYYDRYVAMASKLKGRKPEDVVTEPPGALYRTEIDVDPDTLLDYDKPLSEQSEHVRSILEPWQKEVGGSISSGEGALKEIAFERRMQGMDDSSAAVSQQLKEMGIPGIRYRDGVSRNAAPAIPDYDTWRGYNKGGAPDSPEMQAEYASELQKAADFENNATYNYVMFDDKPINIVERGSADPRLLGALAAGAGAGTLAANDAEAGGKLMLSGKLVELTKKALKEYGLPDDIISSLLSNKKKFPDGIPEEDILRAKEARSTLLSEPATTPGALASEQEWADWGDQYGVNMRRTPDVPLGISDLTSRREISIPGGLSGEFTIPDLFAIKANNFDPGALPRDVHNSLMQKFIRSYDRGGEPDKADVFNALNFSLLSPNAPLTPNEFLAQRARVRSDADVGALGSRSGDKGLSMALDSELGVGAASRGGMGVKGTASLGNMAEMARLIDHNPEMFRAGEGEDLRDVTFRVMNQVPGLSSKTASLGTPFLDLGTGNTSAVDLHMIRNAYPRMLAESSDVGSQFRERMAKLLKVEPGQLDSFIKENPKKAEDAAINIIGGTSRSSVYRTADGELAAGADPRVSPGRLSYEPKTISDFNPFYKKVMDYVDESRGENPDLPLFMEQWRLWDTYRQRVEPHEFAHPDFKKLPKQSWAEMQSSLNAHKAAGYTGQDPVMKKGDWRQLYYGKADPMLLGALATGGTGAAVAPAAIQGMQSGNQGGDYADASRNAVYGTIEPPAHPWVLGAADALRGLNRRLEGSPAGMLAPEATAEWLGKMAYGQRPTWEDRVGVLFDWL